MTNRPILQRYGMWDQLRVDQGKEWYLMLFVQEQLAHLRYNTSQAPHLQTTSKKVIPMVHLCGCPHSPCISTYCCMSLLFSTFRTTVLSECERMSERRMVRKLTIGIQNAKHRTLRELTIGIQSAKRRTIRKLTIGTQN